MKITLDNTNPEDRELIEKLFSTKVETKPTPEPTAQKSEPEKPPAAKEKASKKSSITLDTINARVRELAKADRGNIAKVKDILTGFGVERLSELPTDDYPSMMKELEVV